jgi:hypothetical protein
MVARANRRRVLIGGVVAAAIALAALLILVLRASSHNARPPVNTGALRDRGGAYAVLPKDVQAFLATPGMSLDLTARVEDPAPPGIAYLDAKPLKIWRPYAQQLHCKLSVSACPISAADQSTILAAVKARAQAAAANPAVVGFYVLDDYTGNVLPLLEKIHQALSTYAPGKPVVCGFGGTLDFAAPGGGYQRDYASLAQYERRELLNYSPRACDGVDLYIYSLGKHAPSSDYSMARLLPVMLGALRAREWNSSLLIGAPQAWEGVPPSAAQVEQQTAAFCKAGAKAITAFTWDNFSDGEPELANSPQLRAGLSAGLRDCQSIWGPARR